MEDACVREMEGETGWVSGRKEWGKPRSWKGGSSSLGKECWIEWKKERSSSSSKDCVFVCEGVSSRGRRAEPVWGKNEGKGRHGEQMGWAPALPEAARRGREEGKGQLENSGVHVHYALYSQAFLLVNVQMSVWFTPASLPCQVNICHKNVF